MAQDPLGEGADGPDERGWERPKQDFLYSGKSLRRIAARLFKVLDAGDALSATPPP